MDWNYLVINDQVFDTYLNYNKDKYNKDKKGLKPY